ncbi:hypothetical protein PS2_000431 [Malus domestica]
MVTCSSWPRLYGGHRRQCQCVGIHAAALLRAFVFPPRFTPGGTAEPPFALDVDLLVHVALQHVLLVCVVVVVHVVYVVLLAVALARGCQWNLSWTV